MEILHSQVSSMVHVETRSKLLVSCMTLRTSYLRNYGTIVYYGHFSISH